MKHVLLLLQIIPAVISIITSLEAAIPMSGQGKIKLELLKSFLNVSSDALNEIWPSIEKIVSIFVTTANNIGLFKAKVE